MHSTGWLRTSGRQSRFSHTAFISRLEKVEWSPVWNIFIISVCHYEWYLFGNIRVSGLQCGPFKSSLTPLSPSRPLNILDDLSYPLFWYTCSCNIVLRHCDMKKLCKKASTFFWWRIFKDPTSCHGLHERRQHFLLLFMRKNKNLHIFPI